jgi:hypothetical protein
VRRSSVANKGLNVEVFVDNLELEVVVRAWALKCAVESCALGSNDEFAHTSNGERIERRTKSYVQWILTGRFE